MEHGSNNPKTCVLILIAILSYIFVSCSSESYLDLLTGGGKRYWQYKEHKDSYVSFDKITQRRLLHDENLKIFYINGLDYLSKGQYFKIEGNRVMISWVFRGDTIPLDTFKILKINNRKLVLQWTKSYPVTLIKYHRKKNDRESQP